MNVINNIDQMKTTKQPMRVHTYNKMEKFHKQKPSLGYRNRFWFQGHRVSGSSCFAVFPLRR